MKPLKKSERARVHSAVLDAERATGLRFCVFVGRIDDAEPRAHAEAMFVRAGMHEHPAVLVVVAPKQRRIEIVTAADGRGRISDDAATAAIATMTDAFACGDLAAGLVAGIDQLAHTAGPGTSASPAEAERAVSDVIVED